MENIPSYCEIEEVKYANCLNKKINEEEEGASHGKTSYIYIPIEI